MEAGQRAELEVFKSKFFLVMKVTLAVFLVGVTCYLAFQMLLMVCASILIAIFFRGLAGFLSEKSRLNEKLSFIIILTFFMAVITGAGFLIAPRLSTQFDELSTSVPQAVEKIKDWVGNYQWGRQMLERMDAESIVGGSLNGALTKAGGTLSDLGNGFLTGLIILILGLYIAFDPSIYKRGLIHLFPLSKRDRIKDVLGKIYHTLRWWLIGRFIDMTFVGVLIGLGLFFLDVPLALLLALIAAALNFIPNIGPFLGAIPALLVGLSTDPETVLWICAVFFVVQSLESLFITPMVQQKVISLPPALTITSQVFLGSAFGTVGLAVATPLVAAVIVVIKEMYVKDVLNDDSIDEDKKKE